MVEQQTSCIVESVSPGMSVLVDRSCGACDSCRAGSPLWCHGVRPHPGRALVPPVPKEKADRLLLAVLGAAAVFAAPDSRTVLVVAPDDSPLVVLARALVGPRLLATVDLRNAELKVELFARETSGRAPVIVADGDVRGAVRAVRRGGSVCVPGWAAGVGSTSPSVTELVQREVTLVFPQRVDEVIARVPAPAWSAAVDAA